MKIFPRQIVSLVFAAPLCGGCLHSTDAPAPATVLTVILRDDAVQPNREFWIFVSDKSGQVLDAHQILVPGGYGFNSASADDSVNVTTFYKETTSAGTVFALNTFATPRLGPIIMDNLSRKDLPALPPDLGKVSLGITDVPKNSLSLTMSATNGYDLVQGSFNDNSFTASIPVRSDTSSVLITGYNASNLPVYSWAHGVTPSVPVTIKFSDMKICSKTVNVNLKGNIFGQIEGYMLRQMTSTTNGEYFMSGLMLNFETIPGVTPVLGYIPGFDSYSIELGNRYTDENGIHVSNSYQKKGAINTTVSFPPAQFTIVDPSLVKPSLSFTGNFLYAMHTWIYTDGAATFTWTINSRTGNIPKVAGFPSLIARKFPALDIKKFSFFTSAYVQPLDGYTYQQYMTDYLNQVQRSTYENNVYSFQP